MSKTSNDKLTATEIASRLADLKGWTQVRGRLRKRFEFDDFVGAFGFLSRVALLAERSGHHPDWSNSYGTVEIDLRSHDVGGISARDFELAAAIDAAA